MIKTIHCVVQEMKMRSRPNRVIRACFSTVIHFDARENPTKIPVTYRWPGLFQRTRVRSVSASTSHRYGLTAGLSEKKQ